MDMATTRCWLTPSGERFCYLTTEKWARVPVAWIEGLAKAMKWEPTEAPGEESPAARGPHLLRAPMMIQSHEHSWRLTSASLEGSPIYQCRICEDTATEGASA